MHDRRGATKGCVPPPGAAGDTLILCLQLLPWSAKIAACLLALHALRAGAAPDLAPQPLPRWRCSRCRWCCSRVPAPTCAKRCSAVEPPPRRAACTPAAAASTAAGAPAGFHRCGLLLSAVSDPRPERAALLRREPDSCWSPPRPERWRGPVSWRLAPRGCCKTSSLMTTKSAPGTAEGSRGPGARKTRRGMQRPQGWRVQAFVIRRRIQGSASHAGQNSAGASRSALRRWLGLLRLRLYSRVGPAQSRPVAGGDEPGRGSRRGNAASTNS